MNIFLVFAFLFFIGSLVGWVIELIWRRFFSKSNPNKIWINPGFLTGPYLPLYGFSLCLLFSLSFINVAFIPITWLKAIALFLIMALCITILEYVAGIIFIKGLKIKLWDYSGCFGNISGIICPQYSFYWIILSGFYYFFIHPKILNWLYWFTGHLSFSFVIGFFYGIIFVDLLYTFKLSIKLRAFAKEKLTEIHYEHLKTIFHTKYINLRQKSPFLFHLHKDKTLLVESLKELIKKKESD